MSDHSDEGTDDADCTFTVTLLFIFTRNGLFVFPKHCDRRYIFYNVCV